MEIENLYGLIKANFKIEKGKFWKNQQQMTFNLDLGRQTGWMKYEKVTILVSTTAMSKYAVIPL